MFLLLLEKQTLLWTPVPCGDFVATIAGKGSDAGITVLNSGTNNADVQLRLDSAVAATLTGSQTLTNKTINLTNNSLTGTIGQWNAALSGGNSFTTLIGTRDTY